MPERQMPIYCRMSRYYRHMQNERSCDGNPWTYIAQEVVPYVRELERINEHYYRTIDSFQRGYRPKAKRKHLSPGRPPKKKTNPVEMDGDPRYAHEEPKKPDLPIVII